MPPLRRRPLRADPLDLLLRPDYPIPSDPGGGGGGGGGNESGTGDIPNAISPPSSGGGGGGGYQGTVTSIAPPTSSGGGGGPSAPSTVTSIAPPAYDPVTYQTVNAALAAAPALPTALLRTGSATAISALNPPEGPAARAQARETRPRSRADRRLTVGVPSIVPPQFRKAVAKHGQRLNPALEEAGVDMTGPEYLARLIQFESGWSPTAENPSSAFGLGQFIDSTAQDFRERLGVETQDPSRPNQMIKAASMHASGKYGYGPLYAGYNPGYSDTDPIVSEPGGENVPVQIRRRAAERAAEGGPVASGGGGTLAKAPGVYAGSRKRLKQLLGPFAQTEDWQDKEDRGDPTGTLHDIGYETGYAADLTTDEAIVDRIFRQLNKENPDANLDPRGVDYGTTGLESGLTYKGYDVEFLPYPHGSGPHTHIGLEWTGGSLPEGTVAGAPGGAPSATTAATTAGATSAVGGGSLASALSAASGSGMGADRLLSMLAGGDQPSSGVGTSVVDNPLAAQPAMPAAIGDPTSLTAMLRGEPGVEGEDPLLSLIRPRRRLAGR